MAPAGAGAGDPGPVRVTWDSKRCQERTGASHRSLQPAAAAASRSWASVRGAGGQGGVWWGTGGVGVCGPGSWEGFCLFGSPCGCCGAVGPRAVGGGGDGSGSLRLGAGAGRVFSLSGCLDIYEEEARERAPLWTGKYGLDLEGWFCFISSPPHPP